jgi:hypothetical protein
MRSLLAAAALIVFCSDGFAAEPTSESRPMKSEACLYMIQKTADSLGVAPINIVETTILRIVRFNTVDGSVLVTCSKPDQKMVITKSPYKGR